MRLIQKSLTNEIEYKKNKEVKLEMAVDNLYRRWILVFDIVLKAGATIPSSAKNNDYLNLIKRIIVYHNGGKTRVNYSAVDRVRRSIASCNFRRECGCGEDAASDGSPDSAFEVTLHRLESRLARILEYDSLGA